MTDTWTCFGDPSLMVRTAAPALLTVSHPAVLFEGGTGFNGSCSLDGAKACVTLHDSVLDADNVLTNSFSFGYGTLHAGDTLLLTVTGQNAVPYQAYIPVLPSLSTVEESMADEWSVYPNPSSGAVRVRTTADAKAGIFQLYDLSGRLVRSLAPVRPVAGEFHLDFSGVSSGCYRLVMSDKKSVRSGKLMIR
jgi:gingipain R